MRRYEELRDTQHEIADAVYEHDAQLVVAGMGAGKTVGALTAVKSLIEDGVINRAIVLAPPRAVTSAWARECAKWEHLQMLNVVPLTGGPEHRRRVLLDKEAWDIAVLSLHLCGWLEDTLPGLDIFPCALGVDETSFFKDHKSKNGKALRKIAHDFPVRFGLTGTPRPNGYEDLWGQLQILTDSQLWPPFEEWRRRNFMPKDPKGYRWEVHDFRAAQLDEQMAPYVTSVDVELDLPDLNAGVDFDFEITLPAEARARYDEMEGDLVTEVARNIRPVVDQIKYESNDEDIDEAIVAAFSQATSSGKLAQICQGYLYDDGVAIGTLHREKEAMLEEMLAAIGAEPVLIWYGFRHDLEILQRVLKDRSPPTLGNATSAKKAQGHIEAFERGELPYLLAHPSSAAHGIDGLQHGGRRHLWFCSTWSAEQYDQAIKRLHRPGQERAVFSHRIIAKDTVDELKRFRVEYKMADQAGWSRLINEVRSRL